MHKEDAMTPLLTGLANQRHRYKHSLATHITGHAAYKCTAIEATYKNKHGDVE